MRFRRQMHHCIWLKVGKERRDFLPVTDVCLLKAVERAVRNLL